MTAHIVPAYLIDPVVDEIALGVYAAARTAVPARLGDPVLVVWRTDQERYPHPARIVAEDGRDWLIVPVATGEAVEYRWRCACPDRSGPCGVGCAWVAGDAGDVLEVRVVPAGRSTLDAAAAIAGRRAARQDRAARLATAALYPFVGRTIDDVLDLDPPTTP